MIWFVMILRHIQRYCRYIVTRHYHSDSEVYILPNTHVLGISLYGSGNPKTSLNSLPSEVQPSMPEVGFETANLPISSSSQYQYRQGWHGVGGMGVASEFSSVEKISRWHKLEKGGQDRYMEKCVDIIPLFSVSEQADDFYHAANNLLLSLVAYSAHFFWMFQRWLILKLTCEHKNRRQLLSLITYYSGWMSCLISFVMASLWGTQRKRQIQNENECH